MPPPDDHSALLDIQHYCQQILSTLDRPLDAGEQIPTLVLDAAIERWLTVVGEAVKRLSMELREAHPEVPWKGWAGLRDILIHAYDEVSVAELRRITEVDVAALLAAVEALLTGYSEA